MLCKLGDLSFPTGKLVQSIHDFDSAVNIDPEVDAKMWQRGLSLFYLGRYSEAIEQFKKGVKADPNDTEEAIWHVVSLTRELISSGTVANEAFSIAQKQMLRVETDQRQILRHAYELFKGANELFVSFTTFVLKSNKRAYNLNTKACDV